MMKSDEIFDALEFISNDPSKNNKITYLKEFLEDYDFRRVVEYAYNPYITFGVRELTSNIQPSNVDWCWGHFTLNVLEQLRFRKVTGFSALTLIDEALTGLSLKSQALFKMVLKKDLRAGFDVKTINKARKGTIPEFSYMRCSLPKDVNLDFWEWQHGIFSQEKADGLFVNITVDKNLNVAMHTRKGQEFPNLEFSNITKAFRDKGDESCQYHGEIVVERGDVILSRKEGNGIINKVMKGGAFGDDERPIVYLWDRISLTALNNKRDTTPYYKRLAYCQNFQRYCVRTIEYKIVHSLAEAYSHFDELRNLGKEGTVLKKLAGPWADNTSKDQVKLKEENECDLRVVGFTLGTGKNLNTFGSLICISEEAKLAVNVSGFTDELRQSISDNRRDWLDSIITVKYNEVICNKDRDGHSLFLPRFVERRYDKDLADTLDRIMGLTNDRHRMVGRS